MDGNTYRMKRVRGSRKALRMILFGLWVSILFYGLGGSIRGEEREGSRWVWSQSVSGSVNPLGLELGSRVSFQSPLYEGKRGLLWDSTLWEVGLENSLTPAYDTLSLIFHIVPIAFFDLRLLGGVRYAYDALGFGYTPLSDYDSPFDGDTRKSLDRKNGIGFRYQVSPTLQGAWGNLLFASSTHWVLFDMRGVEGVSADYFYEPASNVVLKKQDFYWSNDTVLAYRFKERGILAGVVHSITYVPGSGYVSERISLVGNYGGILWEGVGFSITALVGFYPQDRYLSYDQGKLYAALQIRVQGRVR
jgi:hypothetical protein